jgi:hypothetical protein
MTIRLRQYGVALAALAVVAVAAGASCSRYRVDTLDAPRLRALEMAIGSAERERMAHVSTIVETQRQLARAEDLLNLEAIDRLMAEAEQEQITYAHLVHAELVLRHEQTRAHASAAARGIF